MSRTIFIGDVHGCVDELKQLLKKVQLQPGDRIVFLGDLLHKGPDSQGVFQLVTELQTQFEVDVICGNHEEKHLRWLRSEERCRAAGTENTMSHVEEYPGIAISSNAMNIMSNSYIAKAYDKVTAVHGGIPSTLEELQYITHDQWLQLKTKKREALGQVLRTRYLAGPNRTRTNSKGTVKSIVEGSMLPLGKQQEGDPYWADIYDGRFGIVVFGHNPFMQSCPAIFPNAIGIDLGCVHGGYLCALILDGTISFKTVKAAREYKQRPHWVYDN